MFKQRNRISICLALIILLAAMPQGSSALAQSSRVFPETGIIVQGKFLDYWESHGGLAQQGFPISEEVQETSDTDGKTYTMQYFERAVFEYHPENAPPNDVLLALEGTILYKTRYPDGAPGQKANSDNSRLFLETGKIIGGPFRAYWESHGGLAQMGFPISNEFEEISQTNGLPYTVQYFERAVFEYHPEYAGTENEVLLSLLGTFRLSTISGGTAARTRTPVSMSTATVTTTPTETPTTTPTATTRPPALTAGLTVTGWTHVAIADNNIALFYRSDTGDAATARVNADGTLTPLRSKEQMGPLATGWSHIVPGRQNSIFFYNSTNGASSLSQMSGDGIPYVYANYSPFSPGWSIIDMDVVDGLIEFYNTTDGTLGIGRLQFPGGEVAPLQSYPGELQPGEFPFTHILPIGSAMWLRYTAGNGSGYTYRHTFDGTGFGVKSFNTSPSWTNLAANGVNLYFYDNINRRAMTATVAPDSGEFIPQKTYEGLSGEWTHIEAAPNGVFLIYSAQTGRIATDQIAPDGTASALKRYSPEP